MAKQKRVRDAETGRFVPPNEAKKRPDTTITETIKKKIIEKSSSKPAEDKVKKDVPKTNTTSANKKKKK